MFCRSVQQLIKMLRVYFALGPSYPVTFIRKRVTAGKLNLNGAWPNATGQAVYTDYAIMHPTRDLALLHLETPFNLTDYVRPVCLPEPFADLHQYTTCYAAGWGITNTSGRSMRKARS